MNKPLTPAQYRSLVSKKARRSKYGVRTDAAGKAARTVDGIVFDSKAEAERYVELKQLLKARKIEKLERQTPFLLLAHAPGYGALKVGVYRADFSYVDSETRSFIYEDVKGVKTALYKLKKKIVETNYGITITEV